MSLKMLIRVALMALLTVTLPSWASDQLPTSENPAGGKWTRMRPTTFAPTIQSAREQCDRDAALSSNDRLTPAHCERFEQQLKANQCRTVQVTDGVVHDYMNGRESGRSMVTRRVEKSLGRSDPALLCDLGDHVYAYWYVGDKGKSCNNVGITFAVKPPAPVSGVCGGNATRFAHTVTSWPAGGNFCTSGEQSSPALLFPQAGGSTLWSCQGKHGGANARCEASREAPPPPPPVKAEAPAPQQCGWASQRYIVPSPGQFVHIPGLSVVVCQGQVAIPDNFVSIPGDIMTVTRHVWVCQSTNFAN